MTSRSIAFTAAFSGSSCPRKRASSNHHCSNRLERALHAVRRLLDRPPARAMTAEWVSSFAYSFQRIRLLQLREIALLLELVDDAEIEVVVHVAAADVGPDRLELLEHAPGAFDRGCCVARHQALEIGVGRRDDFRIAGLELLRDHLLCLLLVGESEVGT